MASRPRTKTNDPESHISPSRITSSGQSTPARTNGNNSEVHHPTDDVQSLKLYYHQLAESEPLSADEERRLWDRMESICAGIRPDLYSFGFVLKEHARLLKNCNCGTVPDDFPSSSFAGLSGKTAETALKLCSWQKEISALYDELFAAYAGKKSRKLVQLRKKASELLNRYPVGRERLREWYEVASVFLHMGDAELAQICGEKLCMDVPAFTKAMDRLESKFSELEQLRQQMVTCNLRLVVSIAQHFHSDVVQMADMIQEGNLGLIRAIDKFDHLLGHRFSTYATWWIKQAVSRAVASQSRVIRLPSHMIATIVRINRAEQEFLQCNGRLPTDEELSVTLELPRERISAIKKMACQTISLQAPLSDSSDKDLLENLLCDPENTDPMRKMTSNAMLNRLKLALDQLPEREQQIIRMRYGLDSQPPKTLVEVSNFFHLTRERIRQIESRAIRRLKNPELESCFQDYYFER